MRGTSGAEVRRAGLSRLVTLLHVHGPMRRAEITERLRTSRSNVAALVESLGAAGVLVETEAPATNDRGRPSPLVFPNEHIAVLAAEIAVDRTQIALVGFGGRILSRSVLALHSPDVAPATLIRTMRTRAAGLVARAAGEVRIAGCCTAVHGTVDRDGRLIAAPNIGWPAGTSLSDPWFADVAVQAGNDAALGAIGEHRRGAGRGFDDLWYISSERGVGGGLLHEGDLLNGITGNVGEVGHMRVRPDGDRCGCGATGCWETEVGTAAFLRKAHSDDDVSTTLARAVAGDATARAGALDVAEWFGAGIASLINLLGPRRIVVGGFLGELLDAFHDQVLAAARRTVLAPHAPILDIVRSELGHDAALIGAAETAFAGFLHNPMND